MIICPLLKRAILKTSNGYKIKIETKKKPKTKMTETIYLYTFLNHQYFSVYF